MQGHGGVFKRMEAGGVCKVMEVGDRCRRMELEVDAGGCSGMEA
jgi:hypothetical protein